MLWDSLAVFAAVAEAKSFTAGAKRLDLPKSTVSRQVAALESELGAQLLYRTTRTVRLTPAGRRLLDRVGNHVAALGRVHTGDLSSQPEGLLRITSVPDLGTAVLSKVVAQYVTLYPSVEVEASFSFGFVDLVAEGFDVALRVARGALPDDPHQVASRVGHVEMGMYAAPSYLERAGVPTGIDELGDHPLFTFGEGQRLFDRPMKSRVASDHADFLCAAMVAGGGIGVLPNIVARAEVQAGRLRRVLPDYLLWQGQVWLVSVHGRHPPPRVRAFTELVHTVLEQTGTLADGNT